MSFNIRPYFPKDRDIIRQLCCDVANRGKPIDSNFPDREIMADLLTIYYTDFEPSSSFIVELDGQCVGYLNGCLDNRRYGLVFFWLILPKLILKAIVRGVFFNHVLLRTCRVMSKNWRRLLVWRKYSFNSHIGHFHIGISQQVRHQHAGQQLVENFINYAKKNNVDLLSASVHSRNEVACAFFNKMGFSVKEKHPMVGIYQGQEEAYYSLEYVKQLD